MQLRILMLLLAVLMPGLARAQLTYAYDSYVVGKTTNYIATVTNYTGGGAVTIPSGLFHGLYFYHVTAIGDGAFAGTAITSVTIPDTVTRIGDDAFDYCRGLAGITIPDSVTSLGITAFAYCDGLTNVTLSSNLTSIGDSAFYRCSSLASVTIPDSVSHLGTNAFYQCSGLASVTLSHNLTRLEADVFNQCGSLGSVVIPAGVTNIGDRAFYHCPGLTNVAIPDSVTRIGDYAFQSDTGLTSMTFSHNLTSLGVEAFAYSTGLTNLTFLGDAPVLGDRVFITYDGDFVPLPNAVAYYLSGRSGWGSTYGGLPAVPLSINGLSFTFNNGAFTVTGCTSGGNVTIPAVFYGYPVTAIAAGAFANNNALTGIVIPNSVTNIGEQAFQNDIYLASVTLSTNLASIGIQAFAGDVGLTSLTIPASVNALGVQAFYNDVSLTNVTFLGDAPSLGNGTFGGDYATIYYYYGTHGWTNPFGGLTAVMLGAPNPPQIGGNAGVVSGNFGFTLTGVASQTIIVEASTNLTSWSPVWTNTLTGTSTNFTDPQWKNFPARFYRAR